MFDELRRIFVSRYTEISENIFKAAEGLYRISQSDKGVIIVEFADNGFEADNMVFDDVGIYYEGLDTLNDILRDIDA